MTIREALGRAVDQLEAAGISGASLDTQLLMAHTLGRNRTWVIAHDTDTLADAELEAFELLIRGRLERNPVVHLTGSREFYGLDIEITPAVLTPRVETEQIVEHAIKYAPQNSRLIDVGTGSGAIAIAIAKHRPDLEITATEISDDALAVAERNFAKHNVTAHLIKSDLWQNVNGRFDTVVTNLPYLRDDAQLMPEVTKEPAVALFGGEDGLVLYRRFLAGISEHLNSGGHLFTECDPWQHEALIQEACGYSLKPIEQGYFILGFKLSE